MNKEKHIFAFVLIMILICMFFSGCGFVTLDDIPRDMVLFEGSRDEAEPAQSLQSGFVREEATAQGEPEDVNIQESGQSEDEGPAYSFLMEEAGSFAYDSLNETEQIWYRDMEQILGSFGEAGKLSAAGLEQGLGTENIDKIFQCILNDHPELFYVEGYSYTKYSVGDELVNIEFSGTYNVDRETALARQAEIDEATRQVLAGIGQGESEYDKVKYVYDTLIRNTDYQLDAPDNQNIYSVFVHHYSVCQGYAKATQYLLNKLGVECTLVLGSVDTGQGHAWNLVRIDGEYYYLDTTWGDASYQRTDGEAGSSWETDTISYDYLNVTTEELLRTHTIGDLLPMPLCTARDANYYMREGIYFTSYDRDKVEQLFREAFLAGAGSVTIKCSDEKCYEEIGTALIENQEIFLFLQGEGRKVAFSQNEKQLSMTFWMTNE